MGASTGMELVRRDFIIEPSDVGQLVVKDGAGAVLARGPTTCDVIRTLQSLMCGSDELTPWSAVVRFRPDGRVDVTEFYRRREGRVAPRSNP
jgi:hypothetical protein